MSKQCCIRDGGRPADFGVQALMSNHRPPLWSKAMVVSRPEKSSGKRGQVWIMETSEPESSLKRRDVTNDVKTRGFDLPGDKSKGLLITDLDGVRRGDGVNMILALVWNVGPYGSDAKGKAQAVETDKGESTDAGPRFGAAHSSDEVWETRWSEGAASFGFARESTASAGGARE